MPNHVKNVLKFKYLNPHERQHILNNFTTEMEDDVYPLNLIFDFDKIIPEPRIESECPDDCKVNKDSHVELDKDRPWFDWYKWRNRYWNTKWGAYDGYVKIESKAITFIFSTAWSTPYPIYSELAKKYPVLEWEVKYADEDLGNNCGKLVHFSGDDCYTPIDDFSKDPYKFAKRLWDNY